MYIALVDDDQELLVDFQSYFKEHPSENIDCKIATDNIEDLIEIREIDVILLDIGLYGQSSLPLISRLKKSHQESNIVVYSVHENTEYLLQALILGANGYISKRVPIQNLSQELKVIKEGGAALSSDMAKHLVNYFNATNYEKNELTDRESQVLKMLAEGWNYSKIAEALFISVDGIRYYIKNIYTKLNVNSKAEAIKKFMSK